VIYIGPGTGVAPFRSIINERINKHNLNNNYLYFGCRSQAKDFYFESEWNELRSKGACQTYAAFSRDQTEKIYVQDLLWKNRDDVFRLIEQEQCFILIAGNSKRMPEDVMAFLEKIVSHGLFTVRRVADTSEEANQMAKEYIRNLESHKRIQLETWA
jgi:sulfite reductase alpha subunit-like flavoprotein